MCLIHQLEAALPKLPAKDVDFAKSLISSARLKGLDGISPKQYDWMGRLVAASQLPPAAVRTASNPTFHALTAALPKLPAKDQPFAESLLVTLNTRGSLSEKQQYWADKFIASVQPATAPSAAVVVGDLTKVLAMFNAAHEHLKRPVVKFATATGKVFKVSLASDASPNAGHLYVKAGDTYLGKVSPQGQWKPVRGVDVSGVFEALTAFAADPEGCAKAYGVEFGECCFCARELTDARSIHVGYGPICAGHYNLPWGEAPAKKELETVN